MSPRRYQPEIFDLPQAVTQPLAIEPATFEAAKLEAYERGYSAGWDDALSGQAEQDAKARDAVLQQLQECAFTYHEARQIILRSVEPVLRAMADAVLPQMMRDLLGDQVMTHLQEELLRQTDRPMRLRHHPSTTAVLQEVVTRQTGLTLDLVADPALAEGRFLLERGDCEVDLDLDRLCSDIRDRVQDHLRQVSERSLP